MIDRVTDAVLPHTLGTLDALSRVSWYARSVNALIALEARTAAVSEHQRRLLARATGSTTTAERRERADHAARDDRRPHHSSTRSSESRGRRRPPRVYWHEGGDGNLLLLLNGWTASGLAWPSALLRRLETRYRVVRIDNRGTGLSRTAPSPFTMADLADDAADVIATLNCDQATIVGYSLGGMIAQELAIRHPSLVGRLVLVASRPPAPAHLAGPESALLGALAGPSEGEPIEEFVRRIWSGHTAPGFAERGAEQLDELVTQLLARRTPRVAVLRQLRAIAGWYGSHRLATITAPTVVLHGRLDPLSPVGNGRRLAGLIPGASYVELPGIGHLVPLEAEEALVKAVDSTNAS